MTIEWPQRLLCRCAWTNDDEAWAEFLRRYGATLRQGVRRGLAQVGEETDEDRVEDMLQEVYCRLLERGRQVLVSCRAGSAGEVVAYLRRVSENVVRDCLRFEAAAKRGQGRRRRHADAVAEVAEQVVDPTPLVEERIELEQLRERFRSCCRQLCTGNQSRRNRRILEAAFVEGWSSREIAGRFSGLKEGSVDSLLYRMRRRFKEQGLELPSRPAARRPAVAAAR